jgi:hypothetical protein
VSAEDQVIYWQRRARDAERMLEFEKQETEGTRRWAVRAFDEQRRLSDRLTFVYGVARSLGASDADLVGPKVDDLHLVHGEGFAEWYG